MARPGELYDLVLTSFVKIKLACLVRQAYVKDFESESSSNSERQSRSSAQATVETSQLRSCIVGQGKREKP